jgi:hypothetical protein
VILLIPERLILFFQLVIVFIPERSILLFSVGDSVYSGMINSVFFQLVQGGDGFIFMIINRGGLKYNQRQNGMEKVGKVRDQQMNFRRMRQTHPSIWSGEFNHFMYKWRIIPASNSVGNFVHSEK